MMSYRDRRFTSAMALDAGTHEGAVKAAATRKSHGGGLKHMKAETDKPGVTEHIARLGTSANPAKSVQAGAGVRARSSGYGFSDTGVKQPGGGNYRVAHKNGETITASPSGKWYHQSKSGESIAYGEGERNLHKHLTEHRRKSGAL